MNTLEKAVVLREKIEIIIPGTTGSNKKADTEHYTNNALTLLSSLFGGATAVNASGAYVSEKSGLIKEDVKKVYAFAEAIEPDQLSTVLNFVEWLKSELDQECIGMELNGSFYLV